MKNNFSEFLKIMLVLSFWCAFAFSAEEEKNGRDELETTFHIYLGNIPVRTNGSPFDQEISLEQIRSNEINWQCRKWGVLGALSGVSLGITLANLPVDIIDRSIMSTYSLPVCSSWGCFSAVLYYSSAIPPIIVGGAFGNDLGKSFGNLAKKGTIFAAAVTSYFLYYALCCSMKPLLDNPFPTYNFFCNHNLEDFLLFNSEEYCYTALYTSSLIVTSIIAGANGFYKGYKDWGTEIAQFNEEQTNFEQNKEWIEESYLDVMFRTTLKGDIVYEASACLRPTPGWKDAKLDNDKTFLSAIKVSYRLGDNSNFQEQIINRTAVTLADSSILEPLLQTEICELSSPQDFSSINDTKYFTVASVDKMKEKFKHTNLIFSDMRLHASSDGLAMNEVFKGTLPKAISLYELVRSIYHMQSEKGDFPLCSWSGCIDEENSDLLDVINPPIFVCRLLGKLGIALKDTSLGCLLESHYKLDKPATRTLIISELYSNRGILSIDTNYDLLKRILKDIDKNTEDSLIPIFDGDEMETKFCVFHNRLPMFEEPNFVECSIDTLKNKFRKKYGLIGGILGATLGSYGVYTLEVLSGINFMVHFNTAENWIWYSGGICIGGGLGLYLGKYIGSNYFGEKYGEDFAKNTVNWIETPYVDLAIQTTRGTKIIYELAAHLRPKLPGWVDKKLDTNVTFESNVQIEWKVQENIKEDEAVLCRVDSENKEYKFEEDKSLTLSDKKANFFYNNIQSDKIMEGTFGRAISIPDILTSIYELKQNNKYFSPCSWSGFFIDQDDKRQNCLNPAIFSAQLLEKLGITVSNTPFSQFLKEHFLIETIIRNPNTQAIVTEVVKSPFSSLNFINDLEMQDSNDMF
ncbi:MAG: hypothetical protein K2Y08_07990 [Alphaproteobacteria bacterium]|nr:hypothetical protein [Silvanigrellaceae bacterium]MBX9787261.1 hypothetical protein [Alphaproteobacteria bacterium]